MRILLIADCYLPATKSAAKLVHDLGSAFYFQGHHVTVLTPSETGPCGLNVTWEDGLCIARVKIGKMKDAAKPLRAIREARLSSVLWLTAREFLLANRADLIVFYSPTIFLAGLVRQLKSLWRCPAYLVIRDIFPEWAVNAGILRPGIICRYFRRKAIEQYDAADIIGVESPGDLDYFAKAFPRRGYRPEVLYSWALLREPDFPATNYRARLGLQEKVVFFYGGNLGVAQDMENILRLAARLSDRPHIHFLLAGAGDEADRLQRGIRAQRLRNIQILPPVPQADYLAMVSEFDAGLVTLNRRLLTHNIPGKILSYMYWGKPILASVNPGNDLLRILPEAQAGFCFENGADERLAESALDLSQDARLRDTMGKNARRLLEDRFSAEGAARQILGHFDPSAKDSGMVPFAQPAGVCGEAIYS